jgi:hypothetical protein
MVFNGHTTEYIDGLDEELFGDIQIMYADGMFGNKAIFDALAPITTALFNYIRPQNAPSYKVEQIFPWINEYLVNPDFEPTPQEQVSSNLLGYMAQAKGFKKERFGK